MRHLVAGNRLGRNSGLRKATVRDIAKATLTHQRACTTKAKALEARKLVDQLITLGKKDTLAARRKAFAILCNHAHVKTLFDKTAHLFKNRAGGYTRIISLGNRRGDNAQLVFLELTEKDATIISKSKTTAISKRKEKDAPKKVSPSAESSKESKGEADAIAEKHAHEKEIAPKGQKKDSIKHDKPKSRKKIMGGLKKMFTKKPAD